MTAKAKTKAPLKASSPLDVIVIGAGPAGIGVAVALRGMGIQRLGVLDAGDIGQSFQRWPEGMRLITPSFPGNQYGTIDLNSIHPSTSPGFSLGTEHPTGPEYAQYLKAVANWAHVPVMTKTPLQGLRKEGDTFYIKTPKGEMSAKNIVWAAGEFHWPKRASFPGSELGMHNSSVKQWAKLKGKDFVVIGGYESGVDAAFHLVNAGKKVTVLDAGAPWTVHDSDPSIVLSPYTKDRLENVLASGRLNLVKAKAQSITAIKGGFAVKAGSKVYKTQHAPILATGFQSSLALIKELFDWNGDVAKVQQLDDQSTKTAGLYLAGPALRHEVKEKLLVFCFIYKYRGRFPLVAKSIGERLGLETKDIQQMTEFYKKQGMYLDDLSCCGDDCEC
jgi:putative flavoprotein involved in K+ transport